jgi:hypothetical protein
VPKELRDQVKALGRLWGRRDPKSG